MMLSRSAHCIPIKSPVLVDLGLKASANAFATFPANILPRRREGLGGDTAGQIRTARQTGQVLFDASHIEMHSRPKIWQQPEMLRIFTAGSTFWKGLRQMSQLSRVVETSVKPWSRKSSKDGRGARVWVVDIVCGGFGEVGVKMAWAELGSNRCLKRARRIERGTHYIQNIRRIFVEAVIGIGQFHVCYHTL